MPPNTFFALVRHIALNLLKHERPAAGSIDAKRLRAGWDEGYLLKVLAAATSSRCGFPSNLGQYLHSLERMVL